MTDLDKQQKAGQGRPPLPKASDQAPQREGRGEGEHMQADLAEEKTSNEPTAESNDTQIQPVPTDKELSPQEFIRSEVNLLNLPFFALWDKDVRKRSETNYKAVVQRAGERLEISWTVAAHQRFGYPGPFDRKVHRAVEQIISDMRPPIANPIPLGSLYRLAKLLGLDDSGKTYRQIKAAFEKLVATTVVSKGALYHKQDKSWIDRTFHLYDEAIFVGQALKGGGVADTNYLYLSDWYLGNINTRYVKPLDYTYYRSLRSPIATRLYELLGVKFYGMKAPYIWYKYSTLCQLLPAARQHYASNAKQNVTSAHQELISTEFLTAVDWENIPGDKRDWYIKYYPGKRVGEEIQRFRQRPALPAEDSDNWVGEAELPPILEDEPPQPALAVATQAKPRRRKTSHQPALNETQQELLQHLEEIGVTPDIGHDLIGACDFNVICDWLTVVLDKTEEEFTEGRAAYLVSALRGNWQLPDSFRRQEAHRQQAEHAEYQHQAAEDEQHRLKQEAQQRLAAQYPPQPIHGTDVTTETAWVQALAILKDNPQLSPANYASWLENATFLWMDGNTAIIGAPSPFAVNQLNRIYGFIVRALTDVLSQEIDVKFVPVQPESD